MTRLAMRLTRPPPSSLAARAQPVTALMNFPYAYYHAEMLLEVAGLRAGFDERLGITAAAAAAAASVPTLFIYAGDKGFKFHAEGWERALAARPGCRVLALTRASNGGRGVGHWVQHTAGDVVNAEMERFLAA